MITSNAMITSNIPKSSIRKKIKINLPKTSMRITESKNKDKNLHFQQKRKQPSTIKFHREKSSEMKTGFVT